MDGILVIDKPKDMTSRDVVNIIGKTYKTRKVGHTGTLDPLATGVLIVCVNKATKIVELLTSLNKEYIAEFILGRLTDTLDIEGNVVSNETTSIKKEDVLNALNEIKGEYEQTVPIYSACKVNGKKLYEYAREGISVDLPKHVVNINDIELLDINQVNNQTIIKIRANVSKGTYIRSLGEDIANLLNTHSTMSSLNRTIQGDYNIKSAIKLSDITIKTPLIPLTKCLPQYKKIVVDKVLENDILDGKILDNIYNLDNVLFTDKSDNLIALYKRYDKDNTKIKPWKMFKTRH